MLMNKTLSTLRVAHTRFASSLIVAQQKAGVYDPSLLSCVTAAKELGGPVSVLVAGNADEAKSAAEGVAKIPGVDSVISAGSDEFSNSVAESVTDLISQVQESKSFTHILAATTNEGKNILPRAAAVLDGAAISDVIEIKDENTFQRPMYAGNAIATVSSSHEPKFLTIRPTNFDKSEVDGNSASVEEFSFCSAETLTTFKEEKIEKSDRPEITAADVVIAGGRALKSEENFDILYKFADKFPQGAAVGASRAAVDAGYAPNDMQIGQTGKVCAPGLYFAVGISGAIQHLAGMKDSKCIVAINTDEEAPIFQVSDYGLKEDLFKAVPELTEKL
eukprot:maker-scaffold_38-snap-gene-2.23-mRNA-1 protein AED:0.01 eAED:0.01 QI:83/1/1/1/1/1/2/83/332